MPVEKKVSREPSENTGKGENTFTKEQLLAAQRFRDRRDMADALLLPGRQYTAEDVEEKIARYKKGKVK